MKTYYLMVGYHQTAGELAFQRLPSMPSQFGILIRGDKPVDLLPDDRTFPVWVFEEGDHRVNMIGHYLGQMPTGENLEEANHRAFAYLEADHPDWALLDMLITDD